MKFTHFLHQSLYIIILFAPFASLAQIQLDSVRSFGTGCPSESTAIVMSPENSSFSILYSTMSADTSVDPDPDLIQKRLKCNVEVDLSIPPGMQLEFTAIDYRGYMYISDPRSQVGINTIHHFKGGYTIIDGRPRGANPTLGARMFYKLGPLDEDFYWRSELYTPRNKTPYRHLSSCDGKAKVRIETTIYAANSAIDNIARIDLDSMDSQFSQKYFMTLSRCRRGR